MSITYKFAKERSLLSLRCDDLLKTNMISPRLQYEKQYLTWSNQSYRSFSLSFTYRFGNYKSKQCQEIDTSRFKQINDKRAEKINISLLYKDTAKL